MHLAETRKIIRRMGVIFSRFTGERRQGRSERGARDTRNGGIHVSRAPLPLCSSFARKKAKKKRRRRRRMPVLQANRETRFLTSEVVLTNHKKLVPATHTQNRQ